MNLLDIIENKGGFVYAHWDGTKETEEKIKELTKATISLYHLEEGEPRNVFSQQTIYKKSFICKAY